MKSALVHDWLSSPIGGSENVLQEIHKLLPSPIFTLFFNKEAFTDSYFNKAEIFTSFLQFFPKISKIYRHLLPIFPFAIRNLDVSEYDLIISSSHCVAKAIKTNKRQLHICYCHTPMRYAWDQKFEYLNNANLNSGIKKFVASYILDKLQTWDAKTALDVDIFIANSEFVKKRIESFYQKKAFVIYPPVDTEKFSFQEHKGSYFITASRLVKNKRIDVLVEAFHHLQDEKLLIVGDGPEIKHLKQLAPKNVEFLGYQDEASLIYLLQNAKAFLFASIEDFGIAPVEAMATGTPVIALGIGGALETVVDGKTGLFFPEQSFESVIQAVKKLATLDIKPEDCRKRAEKFSKKNFQKNFQTFVMNSYIDFYK